MAMSSRNGKRDEPVNARLRRRIRAVRAQLLAATDPLDYYAAITEAAEITVQLDDIARAAPPPGPNHEHVAASVRGTSELRRHKVGDNGSAMVTAARRVRGCSRSGNEARGTARETRWAAGGTDSSR